VVARKVVDDYWQQQKKNKETQTAEVVYNPKNEEKKIIMSRNFKIEKQNSSLMSHQARGSSCYKQTYKFPKKPSEGKKLIITTNDELLLCDALCLHKTEPFFEAKETFTSRKIKLNFGLFTTFSIKKRQ
jgi:hypothetical protein